MKKYYQYLGLAVIMVFSFYYTEKISKIVLNKNPLMQEISDKADQYAVSSINACISGEYIIPGVNGLTVNKYDSFYNMQNIDVFNHYYLVFDEVMPKISVKNNKDKIIIKGNKSLNKVSFIIDADNELLNYFLSNNIKISVLTTLDTFSPDNNYEMLNNEIEDFKTLENTLNLNKINKHICVINDLNKNICLKNKNYLVSPSLKLNSSNLIDVKKNLSSGSIIYIEGSAKPSDLNILLREIKFKNLSIVYLNEIISENHNE